MTAERTSGIILPRFNNQFRIPELTPEMAEQNRVVGAMAAEEYWGTPLSEKKGDGTDRVGLHRLRRFHIEISRGRIRVGQKREADSAVMEESTGYDPIEEYYGRMIMLDGLRNETISPPLARMILRYKAIEDFLPDFMARSTELFRGNEGLSASYMQWGDEELQHSKAASIILQNTRTSTGEIGHKTARELSDYRTEALKKTWELPFPTPRMIVAYAVFQEIMTRDAYFALADQAIKEGAPITADLLKLVGGDEAYHSGGYMRFLRLYREHDPAGTVIDTLHVARNFRMPSLNLVGFNEPEALEDAIAVGAYSNNYGQGAIEEALQRLSFPEITDEVASGVAQDYGDRQQRMMTIFEKRRGITVRESGIIVPEQ